MAMRDLGAGSSTLGRRLRGRHVVGNEAENSAAPDAYVVLIRALLEDRAASPPSCARMPGWLEAQQNDRIARRRPREDQPRWGFKTGSLPGVVNDVGFIVTDRDLLVPAVFCEGVEAHAGEQIVSDIARAALDSR